MNWISIVSLDLNEFDLVLLGFSGFYWVLHRSNEFECFLFLFHWILVTLADWSRLLRIVYFLSQPDKGRTHTHKKILVRVGRCMLGKRIDRRWWIHNSNGAHRSLARAFWIGRFWFVWRESHSPPPPFSSPLFSLVEFRSKFNTRSKKITIFGFSPFSYPFIWNGLCCCVRPLNQLFVLSWSIKKQSRFWPWLWFLPTRTVCAFFWFFFILLGFTHFDRHGVRFPAVGWKHRWRCANK